MKELVDKFLNWSLPESVCSDMCATMSGYPHRTGTTLLTATEAEQMLSQVVGDVLKERDELREKFKRAVEVIESIAAEKCKPSFDEQLSKLERD